MVGYARVSTLEQDPALQHDALTAAGAEKVSTDFASGATAQRPGRSAVVRALAGGGSDQGERSPLAVDERELSR